MKPDAVVIRTTRAHIPDPLSVSRFRVPPRSASPLTEGGDARGGLPGTQ